jgi:hypothetical protein
MEKDYIVHVRNPKIGTKPYFLFDIEDISKIAEVVFQVMQRQGELACPNIITKIELQDVDKFFE